MPLSFGVTRAFKQRRAAATYEALLDGAARVFARRGFDGAQTPEIAAAAGVSTGAFYRYFTDKRQCFVEMIGRSLQRAHDDVMAQMSPEHFLGKNARAAIDVALDVLIEHVRRDAELERVYLAMSLRDSEVEKLRAEFEAAGREAVAQLIRDVIPRAVVPSPRAAALVVSIAGIEVACERAGLRPRVGPVAADAEVRRALGDMLERYLFPAAPAAPPSPPPGGPPLKPASHRARKATARRSPGAARARR
jgi:AcrR family transcriptional regulator